MLPLIGDKPYPNGATVVISSYDDSILFTDKFIAQSQIWYFPQFELQVRKSYLHVGL